jgi:diaminopropionate ammonia-lyase
MLGVCEFRLFSNPRVGTPGIVTLPQAGFRRAWEEITSWRDYEPTPLLDLPTLARQVELGAIRLKDEAPRFGLGSFKALGGAYAVGAILADELVHRGVAEQATTADLDLGRLRWATRGLTVTCATDGNHGRSVAWGARRFGCRCVIFVHHGVSQGRIDAIAAYGAEIRVVRGTYDDSVREAARVAEQEGWFVVSDTSWVGYTEVPRAIMQGYRVMVEEAVAQWEGTPPTHVFIQGGVGGVAAAVSAHLRARLSPTPPLIVVEPEAAACLLASAEAGAPRAVGGDLDTLMAGLACGEPSPLAWDEVGRAASAFMAIPDPAAVATMRLLAGFGVVSGESGVAGLAGCLLAAGDSAARAALGLDRTSRVLAFSTEGATDQALYDRLVGG